MGRIVTGLLLLAAAALAGCNTDQSVLPAVSVAPGQAGVTIERPSAMYGLGAQAIVTLNGAQFASLGNGDEYKAAVPPGPATLTVSCSCGVGEKTLRVDLRSNQQYRYLVSAKFDAGTATAGAFGAALLGPVGAAVAQDSYHTDHQRVPIFDIAAVQ